jgi:hypothetical protein
VVILYAEAKPKKSQILDPFMTKIPVVIDHSETSSYEIHRNGPVN